ncbi:hypothetical protein HMN09_00831600 [Mycena chlorophos]|uniref:Uncharacterized protein n=1 Tax=Mycena chlorophos TaxID=658473 RepID=A0A8H6SS96_MYCCL|nr:hypothetical protein HMN09_00831600 [Mycena chlorophos]
MQPSIAPHCLWFINPRDFFNVLPPSSAKHKFSASRLKNFTSFMKSKALKPKTATVQQAALSSVTGLASLGGAAVPTTGTAPDVAVSRVAESVAAFQSPADVAGNIPAFGHQELECFIVAEEVGSVEDVEAVEEVEIEIAVAEFVEELQNVDEVEAVEEVPAEPAYGQIEEFSPSPCFPTVAVTTVDFILAGLKEADVDAQPICALNQMLEEFMTDAPATIANEKQVPEISSEDEAIKKDEDFTLISRVASHEGEVNAIVRLTTDPSRVEITASPSIDERVESDVPALDNPSTTSSVAPEANQENSPDIPNVDSAAIFDNLEPLKSDPGAIISNLEDRVAALEQDKAALLARVGSLEACNAALKALEARIAALETANHNVTHQPAAPPGAPLPPAAPLPPPLPNILVTGPPTAAITDAALQSATARLVKVDKGNDTPSPSRGLLVTVEALKGVQLKRVPQPDAASKTTGSTTAPSPCCRFKTAGAPKIDVNELKAKLPPRIPSEASRKELSNALNVESATLASTSQTNSPSRLRRKPLPDAPNSAPRTSTSAESLPTAPSFVSITASILSNLFRSRRTRSPEESTLQTRTSSSGQSLARTQSSISTSSISRPYLLHSVRRRRDGHTSAEATTTAKPTSPTKFPALRKAFAPITNLVPSTSRALPSSRNLTPTEVASRGLWGGSVKRGKKHEMADHPVGMQTNESGNKKHGAEKKERKTAN